MNLVSGDEDTSKILLILRIISKSLNSLDHNTFKENVLQMAEDIVQLLKNLHLQISNHP